MGNASEHEEALGVLYKLDTWPTVPGYDALIKGIADIAGIDADTFWMWFENTCESLEQLQEFIEYQKTA
ncbi:MAG: hypothetical protein U5L01_07090 [Rheinheimera sp.]|nr:hypothetical protein [Rheinheimera sp.]